MDNYDRFRKTIASQSDNNLENYVEIFFTEAMKQALNKDFDTALKIARDALLIASYTNIGYELVYIIGGLCEICIDKNDFNCANELFKYGMEILDENDTDYPEDVDRFLDLKIRIDKGLKNKLKLRGKIN